MWRAFFDESQSQPVFVMAGFVGTAAKWATFSDEWQSILDQPPQLEYFKMSEAAALEGQFHGQDPIDRDNRVKRLKQATAKYAAYGIGCAIPIMDFIANVKGKIGKSLDSPRGFGIAWSMLTAIQYLYNNGMWGQIDFVFDEMDLTTWAETLVAWRIWKDRKNPTVPLKYARRLGGPPIMQNDKNIMPLQAADMLAWLVRREFEDFGKPGETGAREQLTGIRHPDTRMPTLIAYWDAETLANMVKINLRSSRFMGYETAEMRSRRLRPLRSLL